MGSDQKQFGQAVSFFRAVAMDPEARALDSNVIKSNDPREIKEFKKTLEEVVHWLDVIPDSPKGIEAVGDINVVLNAYGRARSDKNVSVRELRDALTNIADNAAGLIRSLQAASPAGQLAVHYLHEKIIDEALIKLSDQLKPKPREDAGRRIPPPRRRFTAPHVIQVFSAAQKARKSRLQNQLGLRSKPISNSGCDITDSFVNERIWHHYAAFERLEYPLNTLLSCTKALLENYPPESADNRSLAIQESHVLAWGCLELVEAWRPKGQRPTTYRNGICSRLITFIHSIIVRGDETTVYSNSLQAALDWSKNWGVAPVAFEGRYSRQQRLNDLAAWLHGEDEITPSRYLRPRYQPWKVGRS